MMNEVTPEQKEFCYNEICPFHSYEVAYNAPSLFMFNGRETFEIKRQAWIVKGKRVLFCEHCSEEMK